MKRTILIISSILIFNGNLTSSKKLEKDETGINESGVSEARINDENEIILKNIKEKFQIYNPNIQDEIIKKFYSVINYFDLGNKIDLDVLIAQICVESQAKHYKNGVVLKSSGNAYGVTQIVPTTAHFYLKNVITKDERKELYQLGATDFEFIDKSPRYKLPMKNRKEVIEWLKNVNNNLILWGYIMNHNLIKRNYGPNSALLIYNQGLGFYLKYKKEGKNINEYDYVKKINRTAQKFKRLIAVI